MAFFWVISLFISDQFESCRYESHSQTHLTHMVFYVIWFVSLLPIYSYMREFLIPDKLRHIFPEIERFRALNRMEILFFSYGSQWSRGPRHWIRGSRIQTRPGRWIFPEHKGPKYDYFTFGREVKPWVLRRRFTARKRTSSRNYSLWSKFVGLFTLYVGSDADDLRC